MATFFRAAVCSCLLSLFAGAARGNAQQCVTCRGDYSNGSYSASETPAMCISGPKPPSCTPSDVVQNTAYLDEFHPGLILAPKNGHMYVSEILTGSRARRAGIREGDEILTINGLDAIANNPSATWASVEQAGFVNLSVRRAGDKFSVSVPLVRLADLLSAEWIHGPLVENASIRRRNSEAKPIATTEPFSAGIQIRQQGAGIVISAVLRGSSAYRNGVEPGDQIVSINGLPVEGRTSNSIEATLNGYAKTSLLLNLRRNNVARAVHISLDGMSRILDRTKPLESLQSNSL
jgi:S1-C subfamily serine protease